VPVLTLVELQGYPVDSTCLQDEACHLKERMETQVSKPGFGFHSSEEKYLPFPGLLLEADLEIPLVMVMESCYIEKVSTPQTIYVTLIANAHMPPQLAIPYVYDGDVCDLYPSRYLQYPTHYYCNDFFLNVEMTFPNVDGLIPQLTISLNE